MRDDGHTWALVLAAGDGSRLRQLTTTDSGIAVPKQFCSLNGGQALLEEALQRAGAVAAKERICAVVAEQHRRFWKGPLWSLRTANVIVQPRNRGTANGILLPLLHILHRDPHARVIVLPSDHHVRDEPVLIEALRQAALDTSRYEDEILLLGIEPEEADPELGYIVPGEVEHGATCFVERFVEKPTLKSARALIDHGGLWNSFILAARGAALLRLFELRCPEIVMEMRGVVERDRQRPGDAVAGLELYQRLPTVDFSAHIAQGNEKHLRVLRVPQCGWSDLGTPKRVAETLRRLPPRRANVVPRSGYLDLAAQQELMQIAS